MILETIHSPADLEGLSRESLETLAKEIRTVLIRTLSENGGHVSSNLGIVELTIALHSVFHAPEDKIIWDVGHQCYVHKLLTGRQEAFSSIRKQDGLSGFTRGYESEYDLFNSGHASNSISLAYGMAKARDLQHKDHDVVAIIGDGALTGGMAYEALNNAGKGESRLIVIVNDNEMSIGQNVGHLAKNLSRMRTRRSYLQTKLDIKRLLLKMPFGGKRLYRHLRRFKRRVKYFLLDGVFFEEMGFTYLGPVDGHDIGAMQKVMTQAKSLDEPVIIHVRTVKGKGYRPAEKDPSRFHGIGAFDIKTGEPKKRGRTLTWSDVFGKTMVSLAKKDSRIAAVSAAMVDGTGLSDFEKLCPERLFDTGIAEEHAVTFAAGLAKGGMRPVAAIYSTFLQRAYDSILHDICMNGLPVILAVDRAGIVGEDGEGHQGIYDLAYLSHIPGLTVMAPANDRELEMMLRQAVEWGRPCAIRYPRGEAVKAAKTPAPLAYGKSICVREGTDCAILALGCCVSMAEEAAEMLKKEGIRAAVYNARFAAPLDTEGLRTICETYPLVLTVEDHILNGGFGEHVIAAVPQSRCRIERIAVPDGFIRQGCRETLLHAFGISAEGIRDRILAIRNEERSI